MGILSNEELGTYRITVVINVPHAEGAGQIIANAAAVFEDCAIPDDIDWKQEDGVLVMKGWAKLAFSVCMSRFHTDATTKDRVRHIEYKEQRRTQQR